MTPEFWKGKRVFLTGHTGFKGGWLSLWLQSLGAEVFGFALEPHTSPNLFETAKVGKEMHSIIGDIRNLESVQYALAGAQPEIVFHMAAQPLVRYSYVAPVATYATNVMGTVHLLEAVRQVQGIKAVVMVTSDKCYENREWVWGYRENEAMGGYDPYSNSKGCSELVISAYRSSFFNASSGKHDVAIASGRAGNVIGGGDWAQDRLIPDIVRAVENRSEVVIRSPHAIRPWQHVLEPLSGYLCLAERLYAEGKAFAEGWNFGPRDHDTQPVAWVVKRLTEIWGDGAGYRIDPSAANLHEAHYLKLDCSKAHIRLRWQPRWDLTIALQKVVEWYKAHQTGADMKLLTLAQIREYESILTT